MRRLVKRCAVLSRKRRAVPAGSGEYHIEARSFIHHPGEPSGVTVHPEHLLRHIRRIASAPPSDAVLLARFARHRDDDAFAILVGRYGRLVLAVCQRVLCDRQQAEDCTQATFLVLARKAATIRRPETLAAWLHGTARCLALRCRRAEVRRREREVRRCRTIPERASPNPLDELTGREMLQVLEEEVQRLPEAQRLAVLFCCLEGLSQEETARRLGWTPGSVKGRLERGRERLRLRLMRRGLTLSITLAALEMSRCMASAGMPASRLVTTAKAATLFAAGKVVPAGMVSAAAITLAKGAVKAMTINKIGIITLLLLAASVVVGVTGLISQRTTAAPLRDTRPDMKKTDLWAAITVSSPIFREGESGALQINFTLVNDGKKVIDPRIGASRLFINGKELKDSARIFNNGPHDDRDTALPAGDYLHFGYALGRHFAKPGVYRVSWRGEGFEASEIVFRVLPKKDPSVKATLKEARPDKSGLVRGYLERTGTEGDEKILVLKEVGWVTFNEKTEFLAETGFDARSTDLKEALAKEVHIWTEKRGGKLYARGVVIKYPQPSY
jgi:RNA polymerase sigma factor (sigma-70 family)